MFNVYKKPFLYNPVTAFPELKAHKEFSDPHTWTGIVYPQGAWKGEDDGVNGQRHVTTGDVFRYIVLVYDKDSPFPKKESDLNKVKTFCAKYCGFRLTRSGEWDPAMQSIMAGRHEVANRMIVKFLKLQHNDKFAFLVGLREQFYGNLVKMMTGDIEGADMKKMVEIEKAMGALKIQISQHDEYISENIFKYYNESEEMPTPEYMAIQRGKTPGFVPEIGEEDLF